MVLARGRFLGGGWRVCRLFSGAPSEALEVALFSQHEGKQIAHAYGDDHADAAVEEETGVGEVLREEDGGYSAAETAQGGAATDAWEEDAHQEETAEAAGEEAENLLEEIKERKDLPRSHQQGDAHTDETADDTGAAGHTEHGAVVGLGSPATIEVHTEGCGHRIDVARNRTHRGRKDGGNQQTCEASRQLAHHEEWEDGVGLCHRDIEFGR